MARLSSILIAFLLCFLLASPPAHACIAANGRTVFFDVVPEQLREADMIAWVRLLSDITDNANLEQQVTLNIVRVISASDDRVRPDESLTAVLSSMQCTAISHKTGDLGIVIAKAGPDVDGRPVMCLYAHEDSLLIPPSASECFPDPAAATSPTRIAAEKGEVKAQITMGWIYENRADRGPLLNGSIAKQRKNKAEALKWFRRAAKSGDAEAQFYLGQMYWRDKKYCREAVKLFELAAAQGNLSAMRQIGDMYKHDKEGCLKRDDAKVIEWYTRAVEGGAVWLQKDLGRMYMDGKHVEQNDAEALKWLRLAATHGNDYAVSYLRDMYLQGRGATPDDADEFKWKLVRAENGVVEAQLELGYSYLNDREVQNTEEAVKFFKLAADQGNTEAMCRIGDIYRSGGPPRAVDGGREPSFERNAAKAAEWYRRAAEHGSSFAQSELGSMYLAGAGVEQSDAEAVKLFRLAAARGNVAAVNQLKKMYEQGREATEDDVDEAKWYWFWDEPDPVRP